MKAITADASCNQNLAVRILYPYIKGGDRNVSGTPEEHKLGIAENRDPRGKAPGLLKTI
jgi:hypothetical protein